MRSNGYLRRSADQRIFARYKALLKVSLGTRALTLFIIVPSFYLVFWAQSDWVMGNNEVLSVTTTISSIIAAGQCDSTYQDTDFFNICTHLFKMLNGSYETVATNVCLQVKIPEFQEYSFLCQRLSKMRTASHILILGSVSGFLFTMAPFAANFLRLVKNRYSAPPKVTNRWMGLIGGISLVLVYIIGLIFYDHCLTVLFKGEQDLKTRQKVLSSQKPFIFYYPFDRKVPLGSKFLFLLIVISFGTEVLMTLFALPDRLTRYSHEIEDRSETESEESSTSEEEEYLMGAQANKGALWAFQPA